MIKSITIHGLRGFGEERTIQFAIPNGNPGGGITILVGANNSGKTTILEALRAFNAQKDNPPSFSERKRNVRCENGKVHLKLQTVDIGDYAIDTISGGGSSTTITKIGADDEYWEGSKSFILQSRRFVEYEFHQSFMERSDYIRNQR
ncbi:AAA family ATPase [Granulicatella seriolae]|uniref:AAA family ATPase n=1 Tax=Granulicatella seriolae TaxID=2967226 RepID=A0ABT1WQX7_9LACT|nr:AAA family ATPase [Granulicatella seriolae]